MPPPMGGMRGMRFGRLTEEEKAEAPKITKALIFRSVSYLGPYKKQLFVICLTIIVSSILGLVPPFLSGKIIDDAFPGRTAGDFTLLVILIVASFGTMIVSGLISILQSYVNTWMSQRIVFDLRSQLFRHLEFMSHRFYTVEKQGDLITRMTSDVQGVQQVISGTLLQLFSNLITLVTTLFALFSTNSYLSFVGLITLPMMILPARLVGRRRFDIATETQAKQDEMNQILNETLNVSGSLLLKLFTREDKEFKHFQDTNKAIMALSIREQLVGRWFMMFMQVLMQVGPNIIFLIAGILIFKFGHTDITYGQIMIMNQLIQRLQQPFNAMINMQVEITRSLALFNRLFAYFDKPLEITNKPNAVVPGKITGDLEFRDVEFHYNEDSPILKGVNFKIMHGTTTAIVGPSGAGKSTIINLIPRLYDVVKGSVLVDGIDLRDLDMFALRKEIGYVTQDTYMFNGTVKDNLLYAREDATDEEIIDACKKANIHNFIISLPEGYDTIVGNRGLKLSGGEKQRLSIARVILKNPRILLLDEATSSLDSISESMIQEAIDPLLDGRTGVVIAHRLSTIMEADQIIVLREGNVEGVGNHRELLATNDVYKELYETQFKRAIEDYQSQQEEAAAERNGLPHDMPSDGEGGFPEGFQMPEGFEMTPEMEERMRRFREQGGFRGRGNLPEGFTPPEGGFRGRGGPGGGQGGFGGGQGGGFGGGQGGFGGGDGGFTPPGGGF